MCVCLDLETGGVLSAERIGVKINNKTQRRQRKVKKTLWVCLCMREYHDIYSAVKKKVCISLLAYENE